MVAIGTPCDVSLTSSSSGQFVAAIRRRRSARASSEAWNWNALMAVSAAVADVAMNTLPLHDQLPQSRIEPLNQLLDEAGPRNRRHQGPPGQTLAQALAPVIQLSKG